MPEEGERDSDKEDTLFETFIARVQNHPFLAFLLLFAVAISGIASFTDAVENLFGKAERAFGSDGELVLLLEDAEATNIGFSLVANKSNFEVTSIEILPLVSVDLCRNCAFMPRTDLVVEIASLADSADTVKATFDRTSSETVRVFGGVGTVSIEDEASAPFNLKIATAGDRGAVFGLSISANNLVETERTEFVPEVLFGFIGPPDYAAPRISAVSFSSWTSEPWTCTGFVPVF